MYSDKNLVCADCGQEFVFTASEQDFYAQRGFTEPRRCASCRASRKAARNAEGGVAARTAATAPAAATRPADRATAAAAATARAIAAPARCSRPPARPAAGRPRSRSSPRAASPSTAATASEASAPRVSCGRRDRPQPRHHPIRVVSRPGSFVRDTPFEAPPIVPLDRNHLASASGGRIAPWTDPRRGGHDYGVGRFPASIPRSNLRSLPWISRSMLSAWASQMNAAPTAE